MAEQAEALRLVAERTLGRLAKWLRILGHDVVWARDLGGRALVECGRREGRIVLTRDRQLARGRPPPRRVLVRPDGFREQLRELAPVLPVARGRPFSRCLVCNEPLADADRSAVRGRVPPYVWDTQERFRQCPRCARIYWPATHHARMRAELETLEDVGEES